MAPWNWGKDKKEKKQHAHTNMTYTCTLTPEDQELWEKMHGSLGLYDRDKTPTELVTHVPQQLRERRLGMLRVSRNMKRPDRGEPPQWPTQAVPLETAWCCLLALALCHPDPRTPPPGVHPTETQSDAEVAWGRGHVGSSGGNTLWA